MMGKIAVLHNEAVNRRMQGMDPEVQAGIRQIGSVLGRIQVYMLAPWLCGIFASLVVSFTVLELVLFKYWAEEMRALYVNNPNQTLIYTCIFVGGSFIITSLVFKFLFFRLDLVKMGYELREIALSQHGKEAYRVFADVDPLLWRLAQRKASTALKMAEG